MLKIKNVQIKDSNVIVTYQDNAIQENTNNDTFEVGDYIYYLRNEGVCFGDILAIYHPPSKDKENNPVFNDINKIEFVVNNRISGNTYILKLPQDKIMKMTPLHAEEFLKVIEYIFPNY